MKRYSGDKRQYFGGKRQLLAGILIVDLLILVINIYAIYRKSLYPRLPADFKDTPAGLVVSSSSAPDLLPVGALVKTMDGISIQSELDMIFLRDRKSLGQSISVGYAHHNGLGNNDVALVRFFSLREVIITAVVVLLFWAIALYVYWQQPQLTSARLFHWCMLAFTFTMSVSREQLLPGVDPLVVYALRVLFYVGYVVLVATLFSFVLTFPRRTGLVPRWVEGLGYIGGIAFIGLIAWQQYQVVIRNSLQMHEAYYTSLPAFYAFILFISVASVATLIWRYYYDSNQRERKQLRWIVWGISLVAAPYLLLRNIPQILDLEPFISTELLHVFYLVIPISFGIAIVREQMLDIDAVINRSLVYLVITGVIALAYVAALAIAGGFLGGATPRANLVVTAVLTIVVGLLFYPAREGLQKSVDRLLFRLKYDFQRALEELTGQVAHALTVKDLGQLILNTLHRYLQAEGSAMALETRDDRPQYFVAGALPSGDALGRRLLSRARTLGVPSVGSQAAELSPLVEVVAEREVLAPFAFILPIRFEDEQIIGAIGLTRKLTRQRYLLEEIEFARAVVDVAAVALGRLNLQEQVFIKQLETERLEAEKQELQALQRIRQDLSSMIVHDLRNPLTGMLLGLEGLGRSAEKKLNRKEQEMLMMAHRSGNDLLTMISDLLEIHKMEEGQLMLVFEEVETAKLLERAVRQIEVLAHQKNIQLEIIMEPECPMLKVDQEKMIRVIVNLLGNAIKFSARQATVRLEAQTFNQHGVRLVVADHGPGIPPEYVDRVFDKFVQLESRHKGSKYSTGLGLTFCKLAVETHGGRIWAESKLGEGTSFFVELPSALPAQA